MTWIDITAPTPEELQKIARQWNIHHKLVADCLDPEHLPKHESFDGGHFIILRIYDDQAPEDGHTIQSLTRKIAIFFGPHFILTVHRAVLKPIESLKEAWRKKPREEIHAFMVLADCLSTVAESYETPLAHSENVLAKLEQNLFSNRNAAGQIRKIHSLKQNVAIYRRLLWQTLSISQKIQPDSREDSHWIHDSRDNLDAYYLYADDLIEDINNLLATQLSIDSKRTNEVMRILTVFSVFFMPLTFVVGIYGMNFQYIPELSWKWGYAGVMALMAGMTLGIFLWFRKRGYLR